MGMAGSKRWGRLVSVLIASALVGTTGCYRNYVIPRDELKKLDGFEDSPKRRERPFRIIQSADHSDVRFDATTQLMVEGPIRAGGQFSQIRVTPTHFDGVLLDGQSLHLDLGSIQSAELRAIDGLPTALVAGTITAVGLVVLAGVIFVGSGGLSW
jgi:hypothetical protein